jgi:hypothetical protein
MATIGCKQFMNRLDAWLEGERPPEAQVHASDCRNCRSVVEDFQALSVAARKLGEESPEPPSHLWTSIRAQLEQEGLIREAVETGVETAPKVRRGWFAAFPRPALAGAYLSLLAIAGLVLSGPVTKRVNDYRWRRGTQDFTAPMGAHLNSMESATVASFASNPAVAAVLNKNLQIVDNYITLCEKSVREEPESEIARDYLYDAYQQKADLLAQINEQGE